MPLQWTIDHDERLVMAVAEGNLSTSDVEQYLEQVVAEAAMPYRKIFDVSAPGVSLALQEMQALGRSMRRFTKDGAMGPLALVVGGHSHLQAAIFADGAGVHRPVQIFKTRPDAERWLGIQPGAAAALTRAHPTPGAN
jgi:hypothetical protein